MKAESFKILNIFKLTEKLGEEKYNEPHRHFFT